MKSASKIRSLRWARATTSDPAGLADRPMYGRKMKRLCRMGRFSSTVLNREAKRELHALTVLSALGNPRPDLFYPSMLQRFLGCFSKCRTV